MDRTTDFDSALDFVIHRIAEQANLSGEPLSEQQRLLLNYLPTSGLTTGDPEIPVLVPRNIDLERVCALGKAAYLHDHEVSPGALDWEFAFAVFSLHRHPMAGLLQLAGMKRRSPRWDGLLLLATAPVPIVAVFLLVWIAEGRLVPSVGIGLGCVALMALLFFRSRGIEQRQLQEQIERCRLASHFGGTLAR
jgi:hypothetical protein